MAGTAVSVRSLGRATMGGDALYHIRTSLNLIVDDLELLRSTSNTANGGAWSLAASALLAYKINLLNG